MNATQLRHFGPVGTNTALADALEAQARIAIDLDAFADRILRAVMFDKPIDLLPEDVRLLQRAARALKGEQP